MDEAKTIVVIPCFNEAKRLDLGAFKDFLRDATKSKTLIKILFVNDGSTDDTKQIIEALILFEPSVFQLLDLDKNSGKAEAVRRGIAKALVENPTYVAFWDADLATPLKAVWEFQQLLESKPQIQLVIGSRVKLLGRSIQRNDFRHYFGRFAATLASITLDLEVYDTQCGAKMFRTSAIVGKIFSEPFCSNWVFDIEIIARMINFHRHGKLPRMEEIIYEIPLNQWIDIEGSKVNLRSYLRSLLELFIIYHRYLSASAVEFSP